MRLINLKQLLAVTILSSMVTGVFAEDAAPVYDVDNYPPQFDGAPSDAGVPPPAPPSEAASGASAQPSSPSAASSQTPATSSEPNLQPQLQSRVQMSHPEPMDDEPSSPPPTSLTLEQRMRRMEQQINNAQQSTSTSRVEALQGQVQSLRGQVEELTHHLQQLQTQQQAMYTDVDKRLRQQPVLASADSNNTANVATSSTLLPSSPPPVDKSLKIESSAKVSVPASPASKTSSSTAVKSIPSSSDIKSVTDNQPNVAEEQQIYQTAYDLIKAKKYNDAVAALQKMLQKYPTGQFAANAHYWLGELYGLLNKNNLSVQEFSTVVKSYPTSPKVADAQLKVGLIYAGQFKWPDAKAAFKKVINQYPGSSSARLAAEQLKQLKLAGH
jgi:tol-pal system protein YbgF